MAETSNGRNVVIEAARSWLDIISTMADLKVPGRRDRKKVDTREAILSSASGLFNQQGFAETTVHQIAEAADISERTFFRYFGSKEELLLPGVLGLFTEIESNFAARPLHEDPLTALFGSLEVVLRDRIGSGSALPIPPPGSLGQAAVVVLVRSLIGWEERLAGLIRFRLERSEIYGDESEIELYSMVTAMAAVAAMRATVRLARRDSGGGRTDIEGAMSILEASIATLRGGCIYGYP